MTDSFYRSFEDAYRGSREVIKSRLCSYLPFIEPLATQFRQAIAIDLGCGRGEWLELAVESGFDAYGVDLDDDMLAACRERGLRVQNGDALHALQHLDDNSVALVSAFHMVEHISFDSVRMLLSEALRVLKPGGLLILETPNSENLVVGSNSFYTDPSHERPIPMELLGFAVQYAGFDRVKIARLQESRKLHASRGIRLADVLAGVSPDYGAIAQKGGSEKVVSILDSAFDTDFGISLAILTNRYDDQIESRIKHVEDLLLSQVSHLEDRLDHTTIRASETEARAAHSAEQLDAVMTSRSWRITAPLRRNTEIVNRVRTAANEGRLGSIAKRRIKIHIAQPLGHSVQAQPHLHATVSRLLDHTPRLRVRLSRVMHPEALPWVPKQQSPRAERVFAELRTAVNSRKK